jgi:HPt (histidine-containing phosphotransfer) domain-containing protein
MAPLTGMGFANVAGMQTTSQTSNSRFDALRGPIDSAMFREIWNLEPHDHRGLLTDYAESNSSDITALQAAVRCHRMLDIMRLAHRIAGASQVVGAVRVVAACRRIERAASDLDWQAMPALVEALCREVERVGDFIDAIGSLQPS